MLQVKDLSYGKIIRKINLNVKKGECVSLIGENGSGKSTLLKCIAGICRDYTGEILINGENISEFSQRKLASCVSYVPQLIEKRIELTVIDFLKLSLYPYTAVKGGEGLKDAIGEVSSFLEIESFFNRKIYLLSGGEVQKVLIAGALVQGADFLLLDEPTSHLDVYRAESVIDLIEKLVKEKNKTVFFVSHNLEHVKKISQRVFVMKNGEIVDKLEGDLTVLTEKTFLRRVYG